MWPQFRTPRKNQSIPSTVTPNTGGNTPIVDFIDNVNNNNNNDNNDNHSTGNNPCDASTAGDSTETNSAPDASDSDSISTMSSTAEDSCFISKETLKSKMETIEPGITTTNNNPRYTNIVVFQETMGNAVAGLGVEYQSYGFSCLVDTTKRFRQRHPVGAEQDPADMPDPPVAPSRDNQTSATIKAYRYNLVEYKQAIHMKSIGFALLTETFPNCLDLKTTDFGCPPDFHSKDAFAHVLGNTTSRAEQDKEFQGFQRDLLSLHYRHVPKSNGIDKFFKSIQKLKKRQDLVEPHAGAGLNYLQIISNAQTQVYDGVGGRKDLVHELKEKWNAKQTELTSAGTSHDEIWEQFKAHYKQELLKLDVQGFLTKKSDSSARSIILPEQATVNQSADNRLTGLSNQLDALTEQNAHLTEQNAHLTSAAMSAISGNHHRAFNVSGVPTYIQTETNNGNTSAIGSDTVTDAQCKRLLNEQQISHGKQVDALNLQIQELMAKTRTLEMHNNSASTTATSIANTSQSGFLNQDQKTVKKDSTGKKWYQVKFHCSKHGFNSGHSNENCNSKHLNKGHA